MKKIASLLFTLILVSSFLSGHTRELQIQVVNSSGTPVAKTVILYQTSNTSTPHRSATSWSAAATQAEYGRDWRWTSPNCNIISDVGDNNTNPTSWASISTGTYYLRIDNRYVTIDIYSPPSGSIDFVIKYQNSNFTKVSGPITVDISITKNWPPPQPLNASISGTGTVFVPGKNEGTVTYTWTANPSGGTTPYTYKWYYNNNGAGYSQVGTSSSYSRTYAYNGGRSFTDYLKLEVKDSSNPIQTKTVIKTISIVSGSPKIAETPDNFGVEAETNLEYLSVTNHPNPFNPTTNINYTLPENSIVNIDVYDLNGQNVISWDLGDQSIGSHSIMWNGTNQNGEEVPAGVYLYHFKAIATNSDKVYSEKRKMIFMK